ncbi:MAG: bleomycin resistance family protein [Alphaproteobacteria bacterium]|nr:bleomycin resistance family protein [Alphaproteobacteria bacterium]
MPVNATTPILNVSDVAASVAWFAQFGWRQGFLWPAGATPDFGSVCTDNAEIFLCLNGQGQRGTPAPAPEGQPATDGAWMSWWMASPAEVDALYAKAVSLGCVVLQAPADYPWGVREFGLRHPDGHVFRVSAGTGAADD